MNNKSHDKINQYKHNDIYEPREDSYFLADFINSYLSNLNNNKKQYIKFLDMGCGSGILSKTAYKSGIKQENITSSDINSNAIKNLREKLPKSKTIISDLFSSQAFRNKRYDIIVFNPPYLPRNKDLEIKEPKASQLATTGGKTGDEIILRFLKHASKHLTSKGRIFLLISSLTPQGRINNYNPKILAKKRLFFEELYIMEIC